METISAIKSCTYSVTDVKFRKGGVCFLEIMTYGTKCNETATVIRTVTRETDMDKKQSQPDEQREEGQEKDQWKSSAPVIQTKKIQGVSVVTDGLE
ncbi:Hypothetical predicted protein [Xyrichtys novacula]|uniref:Uncharacterized protein n=1 Tax=Xyrichtys novacula TaxID=13765 RepID=A0AAV1G3T5_XYRNO|nr:Hypothetical predicted protein [Xyrichtys novacula]